MVAPMCSCDNQANEYIHMYAYLPAAGPTRVPLAIHSYKDTASTDHHFCNPMCVCSCNVLGLGERVGFLVLALLLHVDPLGIFLQLSKILLQKPHYPLHMMDGCCLNPRKELVLPRGKYSRVYRPTVKAEKPCYHPD